MASPCEKRRRKQVQWKRRANRGKSPLLRAYEERCKQRAYSDMFRDALHNYPSPRPSSLTGPGVSAMLPGSVLEAMRAMKAELDKSMAAIPATQVVVMATIEGPPDKLHVTGGNVFIAFPRRRPVDIQWILPRLTNVKAYEMEIPIGTGFGDYQTAFQMNGIGEAMAFLATDESPAAEVGYGIIGRIIQELRDRETRERPPVSIPTPDQLNGEIG